MPTKITKYLHTLIHALYPYGISDSALSDRLAFERANMRSSLASRHSSRTRSLTMSIIHARINERGLGNMGALMPDYSGFRVTSPGQGLVHRGFHRPSQRWQGACTRTWTPERLQDRLDVANGLRVGAKGQERRTLVRELIDLEDLREYAGFVEILA